MKNSTLKKLLVMALSIMMVMALAACGSSGSSAFTEVEDGKLTVAMECA
jgi:predicted small lipoprotein YifL